MSYILDALTKSDQERQRGTAPDLHTLHVPVALEQEQDARWPYVLAGALAVAILAAVWLQMWKPQSESQLRQPVASQQPTAKADAQAQTAPDNRLRITQPATGRDALADDQPKPAPQAAATAPASATPRHNKPALAKADQPRNVARKAPQPADAKGSPHVLPPARAAAPGTNASAAEPQPRTLSGAGAAQRVPNVNELPLPVQREIPKMSVSGYSHSADPNGRLAIINDRAMREGDEVAAGLKVEQISTDGVIFSYRGYRFRSGAF